MTDVAHEFAREVLNRGEDATRDYLALNLGEPDLHLVKPRRVGGCVMDADVTILLKEFPDLGSTMGREIIGDDMNFLCWGLTGNDLLEESHELRAGMACRGFAEDFATLGIERCKERKCPVSIIFKTVPLRRLENGLCF